MNVATVVEGPTDRLVVEAILDRLLPGDPAKHRYFPLQPPITFGETGTGWKGVRRWCQETWKQPGSSLELIISGSAGPPLDLLVIHLDADVAFENDLQAGEEEPIPDVPQPCPPASATADRLRQVIAHWLRHSPLPPRVILAIPAQDTETWTFAALHPEDELCRREDYECIRSGRDHPGYRLTLKDYGKLLQRKGRQIKKHGRDYRTVTSQIAENWDAVRSICPQAENFTQDLMDHLD
jgi:hypothetical protein